MNSGTILCHIFNSYQRQFFVQVFLEMSIHQKKKCSKLYIQIPGGKMWEVLWSICERSHLETTQLSGQQPYGVEIRICIFVCFYDNTNSRDSLM